MEKRQLGDKTFGLIMKKIRVDKKMSIETLSGLTNYSKGYLYNLQCGSVRPTINSLIALANALEVSTDCLLSPWLKNKPEDLPKDFTIHFSGDNSMNVEFQNFKKDLYRLLQFYSSQK